MLLAPQRQRRSFHEPELQWSRRAASLVELLTFRLPLWSRISLENCNFNVPKKSPHMRVSQYYKLGRSQPTLSFVDVKLDGDIALYISPRAVRLTPTPLGQECTSLIRNFFATVIDLIKRKKHQEAVALLRQLKEPNETHLGVSTDVGRGRGLASTKAAEMWEAFSKSKAAASGLLSDLEDTVLFIDGIREDIVSDITTNIIREPLIRFTQEVCAYHGIPLSPNVSSGPVWNPKKRGWEVKFVSLPTPEDEKLLLVPKEFVRLNMDYDVDKYYQHYILEYLQDSELGAQSELVKTLKDGTPYVTKKDCKEKHGGGKTLITNITMQDPSILQRYKDENQKVSPPLSHSQIADVEGSRKPDWNKLLSDVTNVKAGLKDAPKYEKAVEALITALFYPVLLHPIPQHEIHDGRKRIDITYSNMASMGFFLWLSKHHPSGNIFFECKNYGREIGNPELDQLSGRFSMNRGRVGLIVCRNFKDRALFEKRCRDTAQDQRGFIMALGDDDLASLVEARQEHSDEDFFALPMFRDLFQKLVA